MHKLKTLSWLLLRGLNSLIARPLIWLLQIYQLIISPLFGNCCRFYPSCSQYSKIALIRYGAGKGLFLTIKRLLRCHPLSRGGFDPVK